PARREAVEDRRHEAASQMRERPAVAREDPMVAGGMPGGEASQNTEQVGDRASAEGEDRGEGQQDEATMGRPREGRFEGIKDLADLARKSLMILIESAPGRPRLLGLLASPGVELLADFLLRGTPLSRLRYI